MKSHSIVQLLILLRGCARETSRSPFFLDGIVRKRSCIHGKPDRLQTQLYKDRSAYRLYSGNFLVGAGFIRALSDGGPLHVQGSVQQLFDFGRGFL